MRRPLEILSAQGRALGLDVNASPPQPRALHLILLGLHLVVLLGVARLAHWPLCLAPVIVAVACLPSLAARR